MQLTKFRGLNLQENSFETEGCLERAENILISRDNIIQKRNGYTTFVSGLPYNSHTVLCYLKKLITISQKSIQVINQDSRGKYASSIPLKFRVPPDILESRFCQAAGNLYVPSKNGVLKIESISESVIKAGIEKAPDIDYISAEYSVNAGIHTPDTQIGYRIVFGRKDANNLIVLGAPSEIVSKINPLLQPKSISIKNFEVTVTVNDKLPSNLKSGDFVTIKYSNGQNPIPDGEYTIVSLSGNNNNSFVISTTAVLISQPIGVTSLKFGFRVTPKLQATIPKSCLYSDYFYRIYRTNSSINNEVEPDESSLQLVYEANINNSDIDLGYINYTDTVNDLFRTGYLYTNPNTGEGILEANMPPPLCEDIATFKEHVFLSCPTTVNSIEIDLIKANKESFIVDSSVEIVSTSTRRKYTAANEDSYNTTDGGKFKAYTANTSVAVNIDGTARSLCRCINRDKNGSVYASYVSSSQSLPGKMYFYARNASEKYEIRASGRIIGDCFNPSLPFSENEKKVSSVSDNIPNGIFISKLGEIEAFPLTSFINVGAKQSKILRLLPLKNSLIILKEDGIFRLSGSTRNDFSVYPLDLTIICNAPDSVVELDGSIYACTYQGVVRITETDVAIISRNIEPLLTAVFNRYDFATVTKATTVPTERLYMLTTYTHNANELVTYVYNVVTNVWTTSTILYRSGTINPTDNNHYAINSKNKLIKMRKNNNKTDFCDDSAILDFASNVSEDSKTWLINSPIKIDSGDIITHGDTINRVMSTKQAKTGIECTFSRKANLDTTSEHFKSIKSTIIFSPIGLEENILKQFSECQIGYRNSAVSSISLGFISDACESEFKVWKCRGHNGGWGNSPWGLFSWGAGENIDIRYQTYFAEPTRVFVPTQNQISTWIKAKIQHSQAAEQINIQSLSFVIRNISNRTSK